MASVKHDDEISAINVTPLVDVVLVLLVIFMITAPAIYQSAITVNLPAVRNSEDPAKTTLRIEMDASGAVFVHGKRTSLDALRLELLGKHVAEAVVLGDKAVEHGKIVELIDFLKTNGIDKVSLGVERIE